VRSDLQAVQTPNGASYAFPKFGEHVWLLFEYVCNIQPGSCETFSSADNQCWAHAPATLDASQLSLDSSNWNIRGWEAEKIFEGSETVRPRTSSVSARFLKNVGFRIRCLCSRFYPKHYAPKLDQARMFRNVKIDPFGYERIIVPCSIFEVFALTSCPRNNDVSIWSGLVQWNIIATHLSDLDLVSSHHSVNCALPNSASKAPVTRGRLRWTTEKRARPGHTLSRFDSAEIHGDLVFWSN